MFHDDEDLKNETVEKSELLFNQLLLEIRFLLNKDMQVLNDEDIHKVKSLLYAGIEKIGFKIERFASIQRLLRELFAIIAMAKDARNCEKNVGFQIVKDLEERYTAELCDLSLPPEDVSS
ncbi:MAG: hypothetical protein A3G33_02780 [Omnitrophica bacterium RIFCSPLOWO2_12_FULL_44_17]|uniref:HPt domain-containing protein n=1 Tax=Candidatus Danuiimicrobium aquiferis TaxID=1801832 RepID=A0A1G1KYC5_9BACT|nr:MAG: hypothetical protein A3E74_06130 [Omnitrophica bacterium RIFCSPHIGHO2_12_FULL_44_12]OGW97908.1 MAG: hypothetical protein A3G33_02780 [Omnitrophica bacterium RIFCSPLOWO2_12_FULL_44_17]OGX02841.1 MAG: hypothetical protein A3J12_00175 [Omnitrophica bacterium RIFCSPLOWO2_02_FULL_44_11]